MGHQLALLKQCFMFISAFEKCMAEPLLKFILKLVTLHIVKLCGSPQHNKLSLFHAVLWKFSQKRIQSPPFAEFWIRPCIVYV